MHFYPLQLFRDVVQTRSISRAAAQNGVTQSAASQMIRELEKQLGFELLDRSRRPLEITPAGEAFYRFCRDVLRRRSELQADLDALRAEPSGVVRVATIYSVGITEISRLEAAFEARCPKAELKVSYLRPDKVYEAVLSGEADLGLVSYPHPVRDLEMIPWREEEMVVACGLAHPLCGMERIHAKDLQGLEFVAFDPELPIRRSVDQYLELHGVEVRISFTFDNIQSVKEAVVLGPGVSILPRRVLQRELDEGNIRAIPLTVPLSRPLGIILLKKRRLTPAAEAFLSLLKEGSEFVSANAPVAPRFAQRRP